MEVKSNDESPDDENPINDQHDCRRAGVSPTSSFFESLLSTLLASPAISLHGFYCHAGNSYASTSLSQASSILSAEVEAVNTAAGLALAVLSGSPRYGARDQPFVLAVGSTPTAHAASAETRAQLASLLNGTLELHAGTQYFRTCVVGSILKARGQGTILCSTCSNSIPV